MNRRSVHRRRVKNASSSLPSSFLLESMLKQHWIWAWLCHVLLISMVFIVIGWAFSLRFGIAYDPQQRRCIAGKVFLIDKIDRKPSKGSLMAFYAKGMEPVYADGTLMAKYLVAGPGDTVLVDDSYNIYANGDKVGHGFYHLRKQENVNIAAYLGQRTLKAGEWWAMGTRAESFDSRYWGPISEKQIAGKVYVLF